MKKIICLFVVFLISNAVKAEEWEYIFFHVRFADEDRTTLIHTFLYPDGKQDAWSGKETEPPKNFKDFAGPRLPVNKQGMDKMLQKDFSKPINVINALGKLGFEMSGYDKHLSGVTSIWFKRKIIK